MLSRLSPLAILLLATTCALAQESAPASDPESNKSADPAAIAFFEKEVRPLLIEHCQACHGEKKQEAGLRLDSAAALLQGSDSGPILHEKNPAEGMLWEVIAYEGDIKMPPDGKLPDQAIAALSTWIKSGAPWPAEEAKASTARRATPQEVAKSHWSLKPLHVSPLPAQQPGTWGNGPVDAFVLSKLKEAGLEPSLPADRRTLIRRTTFDLHGLPPTWEEIVAFEKDESPDAFRKVIDRLLDSPRYGERWGRHWLDVARYADTKGYVRLRDNPLYPSAWTYRDYVIRSFNEDLPYNQFVMQQLAADQLPTAQSDPRSLAAMGFVTLGQRFLNSQHDIIDDRIDVVSRGLLGLTVSCARCHDHKFDPISIKDYYSLHGIFASSSEPHIPPLIASAEELPRYQAYQTELDKRMGQLDQFLHAQQSKLAKAFRNQVGDYLLAAQKEKVQANFVAVMFLVDSSKDLNPVLIQRWSRLFEKTRQQHHPVLAPWHAMAALAADPEAATTFAPQAKALIEKWNSSPTLEQPINELVLGALSEKPPQSLADVAAVYTKLFQQADEKWLAFHASDSAVEPPTPAWAALQQMLYHEDGPCHVSLADVEEFLFVDATTQNLLHEQQRLVEDWIATPDAAPHAHVLLDAATPVTPRVFLRGNASNPGETVRRQFLEVLSLDNPQPFQKGSGRLELAQAIASETNPLTARVLVNRVWMHHFGAGLVRTPSDFGLRGEPPTHPELLDYLADQFMREGWSIKQLHRHLMLSSTYQQQSADVPASLQKDPENRLLWRMNRQRLDWEAMRDAMLVTSGQLDPKMGGPSLQMFTAPFPKRRSVYGFVDRQHLPSVLRTFDFAAPDSSTPQRHQTTVPQQALFLMNSPFLKEQAQHLAARPDLTKFENLPQRIAPLYQLLLGRNPTAEEQELGTRFLTEPIAPNDPLPASVPFLTPWEEYVQALLLSNEFLFID